MRCVHSQYHGNSRGLTLCLPLFTQLLESAGFLVHEIGLHPRLTPLPKGLYEWMRLFGRASALGDLGDEEADEIIKEIVKLCEVDCVDSHGRWSLMYVRLRFSATLA